MSCLCQCVVVKICVCFGQQLIPLGFFGEWSANSFQQARDTQHVSVPSWLTSQSFHFALWWVEDKVLCAVGVLWPPAHAASWWSGAKKTCSSLYKTEKTSELCCHKSMKAFLRERSRRWEKLPRLDSFAFLQTDSLCQPSKPTSKNGVWFLWLAAVPQCCASCNSTN